MSGKSRSVLIMLASLAPVLLPPPPTGCFVLCDARTVNYGQTFSCWVECDEGDRVESELSISASQDVKYIEKVSKGNTSSMHTYKMPSDWKKDGGYDSRIKYANTSPNEIEVWCDSDGIAAVNSFTLYGFTHILSVLRNRYEFSQASPQVDGIINMGSWTGLDSAVEKSDFFYPFRVSGTHNVKLYLYSQDRTDPKYSVAILRDEECGKENLNNSAVNVSTGTKKTLQSTMLNVPISNNVFEANHNLVNNYKFFMEKEIKTKNYGCLLIKNGKWLKTEQLKVFMQVDSVMEFDKKEVQKQYEKDYVFFTEGVQITIGVILGVIVLIVICCFSMSNK